MADADRLKKKLRSAIVLLSATLAGGCMWPGDKHLVALHSWSSIGAVDWQLSANGVGHGPRVTEGFLVSPDRYADFTLTAEFWIEDATNSGIFVRCASPTEINPDDCYEVNIWDDHPVQAFRTGSIVKRAEPLAHVTTLDRWNRMEITCHGDQLAVIINGQLTAEFNDRGLAEGHVALQYYGEGELKFRNLKIVAL